MLKILGYCDRLSVAPGETVRFMVSCEAERYRAEIVRIIHGDANPAGPGLKLEPVPTPIGSEYPGRIQKIDAGSYAIIPDHPRLREPGSFTVMAMVWPTTPGRGRQALIARRDPGTGVGFAAPRRQSPSRTHRSTPWSRVWRRSASVSSGEAGPSSGSLDRRVRGSWASSPLPTS